MLCAAAGCGDRAAAPAKMGSVPDAPAQTQGTETQGTAPSQAKPPANVDPSMPRTTAKQDAPLQITPAGRDDWKKAARPVDTFAREADAALAGLQNAYLSSLLIVKNGELEGSINAEWNFFSREKYRLEYELPSDPSRMRVFLARDGRSMQNEGGGLTGFSKRIPSESALLKAFPNRYPELLAVAAATGSGFWVPLVRSLQNSSRYKLTYEAKPMDVGGSSVTFHRLLASSKTPPLETWEIRFDGNRMLPVTFKVENSSGSSQLNLRWSFSKPLDESKIILPSNP